MTTNSRDFWLARLRYALDKAMSAPSERSRIAYLGLARHYCSMHALAEDRKARSALALDHGPALAAEEQAGRHDFRSVHDALMQAA